jgi:hypothetical protein
MKSGIQDAIKDHDVHVYGCTALCYLHWAEEEAGKDLDKDEALAIIKRAEVLGYIGVDAQGKPCEVKQPKSLMRMVWPAVNGHIEATTVAPGLGHRYVICNKKIGNDGHPYTHFTFREADGGLFDPLPPDRASNHGYKPDSYRVLV